MMTSWSDTQQIEAVFTGTASPGETLLFEARVILDDNFAEKVIWQNKAYHLIKQYGRKKLKAEIETIHQQLFTQSQHRAFSQKIMRLFSKL